MFESWEQEGPESMNMYQNNKPAQGKDNRRQRPGSAVNTNSRLLKQTYASKGKQLEAGEFPYNEEEDDEGEEQQDPAETIKIEIERIEDKIQKLGGVISCGWDPADHKDFLRVRTKHKERVKTVAFMTEIRRACPTIDEDEIHEHIINFQRIQDYVEKKKELMKQYKEAKKQSEVRGRVDTTNPLYSRLNSDLNLDGGQQKTSVRQMSTAERDKRKEQLEKWKQEKEAIKRTEDYEVNDIDAKLTKQM